MKTRRHFFAITSLWFAGLIGLEAVASESRLVNLVPMPEGGLQPQAEVDAQGRVHLIYLKGEPQECDVFYVRREAGEKSFSKPLRVNSEARSAIALGTVRGAQMAIGRNGKIHVAWNGSGRAEPVSAEGAPMLYARLNDEGTAFEAQRNLMTSTRNLDGGGSVAADGMGNVYVVWHASRVNGEAEEHHRAVFFCHFHR